MWYHFYNIYDMKMHVLWYLLSGATQGYQPHVALIQKLVCTQGEGPRPWAPMWHMVAVRACRACWDGVYPTPYELHLGSHERHLQKKTIQNDVTFHFHRTTAHQSCKPHKCFPRDHNHVNCNSCNKHTLDIQCFEFNTNENAIYKSQYQEIHDITPFI